MRVNRYFHIRNWSQQGGATVKVTGDTDIIGQVDVQVAFCSRKDMFCRKTGRIEADKVPTKVVPLRYLPRELDRIVQASVEKTKLPIVNVDYTFAIRYFLPKE